MNRECWKVKLIELTVSDKRCFWQVELQAALVESGIYADKNGAKAGWKAFARRNGLDNWEYVL